MSIFISYMILGLSLSAPVGPVNAMTRQGDQERFWHAWLFGIGAVLADILYMILVYLGVVHFLSTPFMQTFLWLFGAFVLIYSGLESILNAHKVTISQESSEDSLWRSMLSGFHVRIQSDDDSILAWHLRLHSCQNCGG